MLVNFEPWTLTKGAAYFIGPAITLLRDDENRISDRNPLMDPVEDRLALTFVTLKLTTFMPQVIETEAELRALRILLRVALSLARVARSKPCSDAPDLPGDPVRELEALLAIVTGWTLPSTDPVRTAA